jgi:hypothetical protein
VAGKRRLPVLQEANESSPPRPRWQWTLFTGLLILVVWVCLAWLAAPLTGAILRANVGPADGEQELARRLEAAGPAMLTRIAMQTAAMQTAVALLSTAIAGYVIGKWGPGRGLLESAAAGAGVATLVVAVALRGGEGPSASTVMMAASCIVIPLSAVAGVAGALLGSRSKRDPTVGATKGV